MEKSDRNCCCFWGKVDGQKAATGDPSCSRVSFCERNDRSRFQVANTFIRPGRVVAP